MSILHSIVPYENIFQLHEYEINKREELEYKGMLVEVEYDAQDNIVLSRIINAPLNNYLNSKYSPGTVIGKRNTFI